jgi:murein DD-endopeptidase MepM/ murein hydrolase activator NlpD
MEGAVVKLEGSVGRNGLNRREDVVTVQTLINQCMHLLKPLAALETNGVADPATVRAIEAFQRSVMGFRQPDGRVDPDGRTFRELLILRPPSGNGEEPQAQTERTERFPLDTRPAQSYRERPRSFGAPRSGGRKHAGCDLYAPVGTPIYAIDDGEVLTDVYFFYDNTYALEVRHPRFIARYGEIQKNVAPGIRKGTQVRRGQLIAHVGKLASLNMSMLHLELYTGASTGPLTVRSNPPYMRRGDLMDPTPVLDRALIA